MCAQIPTSPPLSLSFTVRRVVPSLSRPTDDVLGGTSAGGRTASVTRAVNRGRHHRGTPSTALLLHPDGSRRHYSLTSTAAGDTRTAVDDIPTAAEDTPTAADDTPTAADGAPTAAGDTRTAAGDTRAAVDDTPTAAGDTRTAVNDTPTAVDDTPTAVDGTPRQPQ